LATSVSTSSLPRTSPREDHLLAELPAADLERLLPYLRPAALPLGAVLFESQSPMRHCYFPVSGLVSVLQVLEDGHMVEIAVIGNDGCVGVAILLGTKTTPSRAVVQIAGHAYRIDSDVVLSEFSKGGPIQSVLLRYIQSLMAQIEQTAVCNRHHSIEQQLCRWLLMSLERVPSNKVSMTQELISYSRGNITVPDRAKLGAHACECYSVVKREADRPPGSLVNA
jgi:CRP-like cAMP-binding protein